MSTPLEYPILFKPEMVRAILRENKTETRRLHLWFARTAALSVGEGVS